MLSLITNPFPSFATERLQLRPLEIDDKNEIFFLRSDKKVLEFLDKEPAKSIEEAEQFIKSVKGFEEKQEAIQWAITLKEDTKLLGTICYWNISQKNFRGEIGYVLHPDFQGKGIMQEALTKVLDYGFNTIKFHSVEANVNPYNEPSIKLLERNKFKREGYFKENWYFNGKFIDSAIYSLLASDYTNEGNVLP